MAETPRPEQPTPPQGGHEAQRVSDADRDEVVTLLREHVVEGRLTLDEFSERVGRALQAVTRPDLDAVLRDLPGARLPEPATTAAAAPRDSRRWHVAVMSGHSTRGRWRIGRKTTAVAVMGGCDLDLRRAEIDGPEVNISAVAFWGGINVIVPEGFDVELRGFSFMGGRSIRLRDVPIVPGSPRIVVRGFAVMGGIDVKSRSSRSSREAARAIADSALGVVDALTARAGPGVEPIDLSELKRQIKRELKTQGRTHRHGSPSQGSRKAATGATPPPPMPPMPSTPQSTPQSMPQSTPQSMPQSMPSTPPTPPSSGSTTAREPEPASNAIVSDGTVTILFCDMVDYAGKTERLGDQVSRQLLRDHHQLVREALVSHGGREINVQGDGFMLAFAGVARALRCAMDIQRSFHAYTPPPGGEPIAVHIGVHTGDAVAEGDDFLGYTVIVASRLADAAEPGEILVSAISEQLVAGSGEFIFSGHRETHLKGMTRAQLSATLSWAR
jgi:class 3 adenylate cyclase